jgi:hypothetical protein
MNIMAILRGKASKNVSKGYICGIMPGESAPRYQPGSTKAPRQAYTFQDTAAGKQ